VPLAAGLTLSALTLALVWLGAHPAPLIRPLHLIRRDAADIRGRRMFHAEYERVIVEMRQMEDNALFVVTGTTNRGAMSSTIGCCLPSGWRSRSEDPNR
jgi:hypothetical protein